MIPLSGVRGCAAFTAAQSHPPRRLHMTKQELYAQYGPKLTGPLPGPKARAAVEADNRLISPSYTRSYPLVAKRGRGTRVEDVDGNEFLDFAAGIAVTSTGHCHPEVVKAIQQQAGELIHMSGTDFYYEGMVTLAERLSAVAPMPGPHRFYYGNSGAEAAVRAPGAGGDARALSVRIPGLFRWPAGGRGIRARVCAVYRGEAVQ